MRVRATQLGTYGHRRRNEGDEFTLEPIKRMRPVKDKDGKPTGEMREVIITAEQQFSPKWMEKVEVPSVKKDKKNPAQEPAPTEGL